MGVSEDNQTSGYIEKSKLTAGRCRDYITVFHPFQLIADSTPLSDILPIMRQNHWIFVLDKNRVTSIVTRADLQKAPVRLFMFGLITLLEMNMQRIIESFYRRDSWQGFLSPGRLQIAHDLLIERQKRNEAIGLVDCLHFCDKGMLIIRSEEIRKKLGIKSNEKGRQLLKAAEGLRNKLAHARDIVAGSTWEEIIDLADNIGSLVQHCEGFSRLCPKTVLDKPLATDYPRVFIRPDLTIVSSLRVDFVEPVLEIDFRQFLNKMFTDDLISS